MPSGVSRSASHVHTLKSLTFLKSLAQIKPILEIPMGKRGVIVQPITITSLFLYIFVANSTPPEDPIKCSSNNTNCTITNSYGTFPDRSMCQVAKVAYPTTEEELISTVANATEFKTKIRVATRFSHSIPKLVCPDGTNGLLISTKYLNRIIEFNVESETTTVEAGVILKDLIREAAKVGFALPYAPYWWGVTIGGLLGTGAHGSTLWGNGSAVHDYVVGLTVVSPGGPQDGYVKIRNLDESNDELRAAKVSLGVLGVISKVTLKLQPVFKRSISYVMKNDIDLGDEAATFGSQNEFADISWYPSQRKAIYRIDDRVSSNTPGNGLYDYIPFRPTPSSTLALLRTTEESQELLRDADGKCLSARVTTSTLLASAFGLTNDGILFTGYPVIGFNHRLQSSGTCLDSPQDSLLTTCPWDPRVKGEYFHQSAFSISSSLVKNFIQDVQKLVNLEPTALCGLELYNGILMRYVTKSSAYLGKQQDAIDFDITFYRSKDPKVPRLYEDVIEEIEQMAIFKYGALPHWGKNRNVAFVGAFGKYNKAGEFLKVKDMYDPFGLFSNEWTDQILGLKDGVTTLKDGCALEGLCVCSEDSHCAPSKGHFCRPGKIYTDARVCTSVN